MIRRRPFARRVTFLGGMHWPPNAEGILWFAREVWPRVQREVPEAVLTIIGRNPPRGIKALRPQARSAYDRRARSRTQSPAVEVTGYAKDPQPYLEGTAVFVVPLHAGGGMRVKILDAWAWGLPVVSTTIGAEGIEMRDGDNMLIADTPAEFSGAVIRLLQEPTLAQRLRENGRRWVEERYDWHTVYRLWDEVYATP